SPTAAVRGALEGGGATRTDADFSSLPSERECGGPGQPLARGGDERNSPPKSEVHGAQAGSFVRRIPLGAITRKRSLEPRPPVRIPASGTSPWAYRTSPWSTRPTRTAR